MTQGSRAESESPTERPLFADDELAELRGRWAAVQAAFVDDPKECVQKADVLVSDLVEQLTTGFAGARSREGLGLGLHIVQEIARMHGGNVGVDSNEATGTVFTIELQRMVTLQRGSFTRK